MFGHSIPKGEFCTAEGIVILGGPLETSSSTTALANVSHGEWPRPSAVAFGATTGPFVRGLVEARLRLMRDCAALVM